MGACRFITAPPTRAGAAVVAAVLALLLAFCCPSVTAISLFDSDVSFKKGEWFYVGAEPYRAPSTVINYGVRTLPLIALDAADKVAKERAVKTVAANLGMRLRGNRARPTIFSFQPMVNHTAILGRSLFLKMKAANRLMRMCRRNYTGSFSLGSLSGVFVDEMAGAPAVGSYPIGYPASRWACNVVNAFDFVFYYKTERDTDDTPYYTVNGFKVRAWARDYSFVNTSVHTPDGVKIEIHYSASWVEDENEVHMAAIRQDTYAAEERARHKRGHFISSLNVFLIWAVAGMLVTSILFRTVRRDLLEETDPEQIEDLHSGGKWKLVQGDVFRPPSHPIAFAAVAGAGAQLLFMIVLTFLCSVVGVMHPSQQGNLLTGLVFTYIFSSSVCGFVVARLLKLFKVLHNMKALFASLLLPCALSVGYVVLNTIQWLNRTGTGAPFSTVALLLVLELVCAIPLVFVGVVLGYRLGELSVPCKPSALPRLIPVESRRAADGLSLLGSVLPFLASFIELTYVFDSMWQNSAFYRLNVLFWQALVILSLCAEVSIIVTYMTLSQQNYMWWWKSISSVGYCGLYVFLYSIYYMFATLGVTDPLSMFIFCGYMAGFSVLMVLVTGTVGFVSSFLFVRVIYGASKSD